MNNRWLTIKQLDAQLKEWQTLIRKFGRPRGGWVKTLRTALKMSAEQLADRLGVTRSRIAQLENAEIHEAVTLRTLRDVANALECEFVYAIVPKEFTSLESIIKAKIDQIVNERVASVAHSMSLEQQSVNADIQNMHKNELKKYLIEHLNKNIWNSSEMMTYQKKNGPEKLKPGKKGKKLR